jgi:outer membrane protein assembly factor BamA
MRPPGACVVFIAVLSLAVGHSLHASPQQEEWEGKEIEAVTGVGFTHENMAKSLALTGLKKTDLMTREKKDAAIKELFGTNKFDAVDVKVEINPATKKAIVTVIVTEYVIVEKVEFQGINEIPINTLKPTLRISAGAPLNPYHLKQDREYIRDQYLQKGYHFSSVEEQTKPGTTGVVLTWVVVEGPLVTIDEILFTGDVTVNQSELRNFILSKQNDRLFGLIPTGKNPFIERSLKEDVER